MNSNDYTRSDVPSVINGFGKSARIETPGNTDFRGAKIVMQKLLDTFPGDLRLVLGSGSVAGEWTLRPGIELPKVTVGFRVISMTHNDGRSFIQINGASDRVIYNGDFVDGADLKRLVIKTTGSGSETVAMSIQAWGYDGGGGITPTGVFVQGGGI
jgi:hypothetical protein